MASEADEMGGSERARGYADNAQIDMANRRHIEHRRGKERNEDLFLETVAMER